MRQPKPWFRKFNQTWYVQIGTKQVRLAAGKNAREAAFKKYHELMAQDCPADVVNQRGLATIVLCDQFLDWTERHRPKSYEWYRGLLQDFCSVHGKVAVIALKPFHVTAWLDSHTTWGQATRRGAITALKRVLNWACDEGILDVSPLRSLRRPAMPSRERVLTEVEHRSLMDLSDDCFADVLTAFWHTGARPNEIGSVSVDDVSLEKRVWILRDHKTANSTGKPRLILLDDTMLQLTQRLMTLHVAGPLFRNSVGKPWTTNAIRLRMKRLCESLNLNGVSAYTYRHTYATRGLVNGVPIAAMAELLGHSDTKMLSKHYAHLTQNLDYLAAEAAKVVTSA